MKSMSLFCLLTHLFVFTSFLQAQNILFRSSDEKSIAVPTDIMGDSVRIRESVPDQGQSTVMLEVPFDSLFIERLIGFSTIKSPINKSSNSRYGELLAYIHTFYKVRLSKDITYRKTLVCNEKLSREVTANIISSMQHEIFPTLSSESVESALVNELSEQVDLAEYLGLSALKERFIRALAGALTFNRPSQNLFMLPFMRKSLLPYGTKAQVVKSICDLSISNPNLSNFLRVILDQHLSLSKARILIGMLDNVAAHNLLYILETYFEPTVIHDLREQESVEPGNTIGRLEEIARLEDTYVKRARTLLIIRIAETIDLMATDKELENVLVYSSLPINTVAEIMQVAIERYPGFLLEFVDIESINALRDVRHMSPLFVFPEMPKTEPFKKRLLSLQQKHPYVNVDRLYNTIMDLFENTYGSAHA